MKIFLSLIAALLVLAGLVVIGVRWVDRQPTVEPASTTSPAATHPDTGVGEFLPAAQDAQGFLYGRVTTGDGATHVGRLRWGGDEEAFWSEYFNGTKADNAWAARVPPDELPKERIPIGLFGVELAVRERPLDLDRPFMARFGDITRIEANGPDLWVTLKSGTVFHLDRYAADDFADGLRVWDGEGGVVDLGERQVRSVELLPTPDLVTTPGRLHGTVRTRAGDFSGAVQWDREEGVVTDRLDGLGGDASEGEVSLPYGNLRSIARHSRDSVRVTLADGREMVLSGTREAGDGHLGIYVDDRRYGRVLVSWDAFERIDFSPGGSGPAYDDFPPGHPLTGSVTTRDGRRHSGRLVFDLDESETTETLDAPARGVDYTIPFGLVASIRPEGEEGLPRVGLHNGEELRLDPRGDLSDGNAGLLVFADGGEVSEYVPWSDVERIDLDRPPATYPPLGE